MTLQQFYSTGDYMKYNGKMAVAVTLVAWGLDEFYDGYSLAGLKTEGREMVRWGTDYLLKTIVEGTFQFYFIIFTLFFSLQIRVSY